MNSREWRESCKWLRRVPSLVSSRALSLGTRGFSDSQLLDALDVLVRDDVVTFCAASGDGWISKDEQSIRQRPGCLGAQDIQRLSTYQMQAQCHKRISIKLFANRLLSHRMRSPWVCNVTSTAL